MYPVKQRGGPGFVKVLDGCTSLIAGRRGNNKIPGLRQPGRHARRSWAGVLYPRVIEVRRVEGVLGSRVVGPWPRRAEFINLLRATRRSSGLMRVALRPFPRWQRARRCGPGAHPPSLGAPPFDQPVESDVVRNGR